MQLNNTNQKSTKSSQVMSALLSSAKNRLPLFVALAAIVVTATFLRADPGENHPEQNHLEGTWISVEFGGSNLASYMSDGRMFYTIPITILTGNGPGGSSELASSAHGEWIRTGHHEFVSTSYSLLSSPTVDFTHLVKLTNTLKLNDASDELTQTGTVSVYFPDGTLQFSFPGAETHFKRVVAGQ